MIRPRAEDLLREASKSLEMDVLPVLPKGIAQNQLKAALHLFNRLAKTWDRVIPTLLEDNRDVFETLRTILTISLEKSDAVEQEPRILIAELDKLIDRSQMCETQSVISVDTLSATNAALQDITIRVHAYLRERSRDHKSADKLLALLRRTNARELYTVGESASDTE